MISEKEAQDLISKLKKLKEANKKDKTIKKELVEHEKLCLSKFKYLITMKLGRYKTFNNYEDLYQEGCEALLRAFRTYDSSKGSVFWWCHKYIDTRISRSANSHSAIKYPLKVAKQTVPHKEIDLPILIEETNCPDKQLEIMQYKEIITESMKSLSEKQKKIVSLAFGMNGDKPQSINKVAKKIKMSRSAVIKDLKVALFILKEKIKQNG